VRLGKKYKKKEAWQRLQSKMFYMFMRQNRTEDKPWLWNIKDMVMRLGMKEVLDAIEDEGRKSSIYVVSSIVCKDSYVGMTKRNITVRFEEEYRKGRKYQRRLKEKSILRINMS
jgi:hypothetical protein